MMIRLNKLAICALKTLYEQLTSLWAGPELLKQSESGLSAAKGYDVTRPHNHNDITSNWACKQAGQSGKIMQASDLTDSDRHAVWLALLHIYRLGLGLNYNIRPSVECLTLCFKNLNCLAKNIVIGVTVQAKCFCVGSYSRATDNSWTPSVHLTNAPVWLT